MPRIKVLTDSTCDLPSNYFRDYDIGVVPINIQFGTETFQEGITIDPATFYKKVDDLGMIPQTSQPSVGQFVDAYRAIAQQGYDTIFSLHVTGKLSGTLNSATIAAREVENEIKVIPYDSLCGSGALGFMCVDVVQMVQAGTSAQDILLRLDAVRPRVGIFFALATLRYAQMSGRIGNLQGFIASLLSVKPIVSLNDGVLAPSGRVRSRQAAIDLLIQLAKEKAGDAPVKFAAIHAEARADAEILLERANSAMNCVDAFVDDLAISLAVHFGPGVIGAVVYPAT